MRAHTPLDTTAVNHVPIRRDLAPHQLIRDPVHLEARGPVEKDREAMPIKRPRPEPTRLPAYVLNATPKFFDQDRVHAMPVPVPFDGLPAACAFHRTARTTFLVAVRVPEDALTEGTPPPGRLGIEDPD